jgi:molybdopterin molybdotransferase
MTQPLDLREAQQLILAHVKETAPESISLQDAFRRIPCRDIRAPRSVPAFPRSAMDGFAVIQNDIANASTKKPVSLPVVNEIPAGRTDIPRLHKGQAIKIMTGGAVPHGADTIMPFELCREEKKNVSITSPSKKWAHVRKTGCEIKKSQIIVRKGNPIDIEHLPLLAESGVQNVPVYSRPVVALLATGSELLESDASPQNGQIVSGNRFLLSSLLQQAGADSMNFGIARDNVAQIAEALSSDKNIRMIISTGGMGPGKYDLMAEVYKKLDIHILYDSLNIRPGRSTMFGVKGNTLYFALPGPPPAVRLLFHQLVRPAILRAQGIPSPLKKGIKVILAESISLKKTGIQNLKGGQCFFENGELRFRPARKNEPINSIALIPSNRRSLLIGERITVHRINS